MGFLDHGYSYFTFVAEAKKVAREVSTEGKLGVQWRLKTYWVFGKNLREFINPSFIQLNVGLTYHSM